MGTLECLQPCDIASGPMVRIGIMKETEKSSRITGAGSFPATPCSFRLMSGPPRCDKCVKHHRGCFRSGVLEGLPVSMSGCNGTFHPCASELNSPFYGYGDMERLFHS